MKFLQRAKNGYAYDKRIFWSCFLVVCLICLSILYQFGFDFGRKLYVKCESPICENDIPYNTELSKYCHEDWCKQDVLEMGEYGTPPPKSWLFNNFGLLTFLIFILGIGINHFIHNRGKQFEVMTDHIPKWMKKLGKKIDKIELKDDLDDNKSN